MEYVGKKYMKYVWLVLSIFFGMAAAGGIATYVEKKEDLSSVIFVVLLTVLFGYLYNKSKSKGAKPTFVVQNEPQKSNNLELVQFFEKPTQEIVETMQAKFDVNTDDFMKKQEISDSIDHIIDLAYKDGIITDEEENKIVEYMKAFNMTTRDLPARVHEKLIKGLIIRDLLAGIYNNRVVLANVPFNFMKSEKVIFAYPSISVSEIKTVTEYQAGSRGMSFRIMKGVYYHTGGTKGTRTQKQVLKDLGYSNVAITNKHLYFQANGDAMRVKHEKIVSIIPDATGVTVYREGARSNPLYFNVDDAWFFSNILQNAQNVE